MPIRYGAGRLAELGEVCAAAGMKNPLIVTDRGSRNLAFIAEAGGSLKAAGLSSGLFSEVAPNPSDRDVAAGKAAFAAGGHDRVIAIGGGSGMDAGKAISLVARNNQALWDFDFDNAPPVIAPRRWRRWCAYPPPPARARRRNQRQWSPTRRAA